MPQRVLPRHLGIIMDGNGRWAKKRGLPRSAGHVAGARVFKTIVRYCSRVGIEYLTIYAFSTENWKRPVEEVSSLMGLFKTYLRDALDNFLSENVKVQFMGDTSAFDPQLKELIQEITDVSANRTGMVLNIALNYGGRAEIARAVQLLASDVQNGKLQPEEITEEMISSRLYTAGQPDPDLIIRPSGENRTSNFMLWQSAYAEYLVMDILWPDFTTKNLEQAFDVYAARSRRYGGV